MTPGYIAAVSAARSLTTLLAFLFVFVWALAGCGSGGGTGLPPAEPLDLAADRPTFIFFYTDN